MSCALAGVKGTSERIPRRKIYTFPVLPLRPLFFVVPDVLPKIYMILIIDEPFASSFPG